MGYVTVMAVLPGPGPDVCACMCVCAGACVCVCVCVCTYGIVNLSCCLDLSGQSSCGDGVVMLACCAYSSSFRESTSCGALVGRSVPTLQLKIVLSWCMKAEAVRVQTLLLNRTSCSH